jgi:Flp pilus assembly pilin Flp
MKKLKELYEKFCARLFSIIHAEKGQTVVEYALLLVLIAIVVYLMIRGVGLQTNCVYSRVNSALGGV